jgi:hypothetical protein
LAPVQNQQLLEPVEQFACDLLDLGAFLGGQFRGWPCPMKQQSNRREKGS